MTYCDEWRQKPCFTVSRRFSEFGFYRQAVTLEDVSRHPDRVHNRVHALPSFSFVLPFVSRPRWLKTAANPSVAKENKGIPFDPVRNTCMIHQSRRRIPRVPKLSRICSGDQIFKVSDLLLEGGQGGDQTHASVVGLNHPMNIGRDVSVI